MIKTQQQLPAGAWPVMLTPFEHDGRVDWSGYEALIDFYLDAGSAGLFASCLSSEIEKLSADEIVELSAVAQRRASGRASVVAGAVMRGSVEQIAQLTRRVSDTGVSAVVIAAGTLAPADAQESEWRDAFATLMDLAPDAPLGIYECPWPIHRRLSADTMRWLAETGRVLFHKDTACEIGAIQAKCHAVAGSPLAFFNAHQPTLRRSLAMGAAGYSGVGCNFIPEAYVAACRNGDDDLTAVAWRLLDQLEPLIGPGYPANAKAFLAGRGVPISTTCRVDATVQPQNLRALDGLRSALDAWLGDGSRADLKPQSLTFAGRT
jgi:4-hydroxy-tetrahydrodipicolinate synthase